MIEAVQDLELFPGWEGTGFIYRNEAGEIVGRVGYGVRAGQFWMHDWQCCEGTHAAASLWQAVRNQCRLEGFERVHGWIIPPHTMSLKLLRRGRVRLECAEVSFKA